MVVLLGLEMPPVDGLEDPVPNGIPIAVLASSRQECDIVESYNLGANAYVVKPVDPEKFVEAAKRISLFSILINEAPPPSRRGHEGP